MVDLQEFRLDCSLAISRGIRDGKIVWSAGLNDQATGRSKGLFYGGATMEEAIAGLQRCAEPAESDA